MNGRWKWWGSLALAAVLTVFAAVLLLPKTPGPEPTPAPAPVLTPTPSPTPEPTPDPYRNDYAQVDVSRLDHGVVRVRYTGGADKRVKTQITKTGGEDYNYDLSGDGSWETFTLTEGDGEYTLRVLENKQENRYSPVFTCSMTLTLPDPESPFRESSQFVRFRSDSAAAALASELTEGLETEEEKAEAVFDYVAENLTYDEEKSAAVEAGYLPDVDQVLEQGKGICFDYAALMAAMLRSQGVACKLAVGYAGKTYHAWVETPDGAGGWRLMDPTFVSANRDDQNVLDFVSDPDNYQVRYYY